MTSSVYAEPGPAVRDLHLRPPVWLDEDASLGEVARAMDRAGVSAIIIGPAAAIVTEHDIVHAVAADHDPHTAATSVASDHTICLADSATALEALATMLRYGVRHLVILDRAGVPCGVLPIAVAAAAIFSRSDVPEWLAALRVVLRVGEESSS
jgi:signal-transduction protein with cAMP-binding, CBS, and nucleotidyltransferase domain